MTPKLPRLTAEHLPVGQSVDLGSHFVSEAEIMRFASEWDSQYFHTDLEAARGSHFGGLIASGLHTLSIFQRLSVLGVLNHYDVIAGKEVSSLRFLHPVRPGDVLTGTLHVDSLAHDGRGRALVCTSGALTNQDGIMVLSVHMEALMVSNVME